jgi:hypothetical protein
VRIPKNWKKALTVPTTMKTFRLPFVAGWSSLVARQAHNLKVAGSNPAPAPNYQPSQLLGRAFCCVAYAIFERATARVQLQSTRGNFQTHQPKVTPNIFRAQSQSRTVSSLENKKPRANRWLGKHEGRFIYAANCIAAIGRSLEDGPDCGIPHRPRPSRQGVLPLDGRRGVKAGVTHGSTDDFGFNVIEKPVHVHDLQATIMHCLGINHTRLTYRFQGRQFRLTDVHGEIVKEILA